MIDDFLRNGAIMSTKDRQFLLGWGRALWSNKPENSFYFPDYFLESHAPWVTFEHMQVFKPEKLAKLLNGQERTSFKWKTPFEKCYHEKFAQLKTLISSGTLLKGVPYVMFQADGDFNISIRMNALKRLLSKSNLYIYGFWNVSEGLLGGTPELLFSQENEVIHTSALAGTASFAMPDETFLNEHKQRKEHRFVLEGIASCLKKFGSVIEEATHVTRYSTLKHLHTPISCKLKRSVSFEEMVAALHPTPALGTYPKEKGIAWLKEYDKHIPRGRYGAPVGYCFNGDAVCYVAIRNIQWSGQKLSIGAGGGVVSDSQIEHEWKEILLKLSSIQEQLDL